MSRKNGTRITRSSYDRKLRYRALLEDLSTIDDDANSDVCMEKTTKAVREAQQILADGGSYDERAQHPGEGYLDSTVLKATSDLAVRCSEAFSVNANVYDKHQLARHILENPEFWCVVFPREAPRVSFLYGAFAAAPPAQAAPAPRRRLEKQAQAALKKPEMVEKQGKTEEGSEMVSRVNRFITSTYRNNNKTPLSYFHVVLDPGSFAKTVENVYNVSFLVKDGLISVDLDEDKGLPFITPVPESNREGHDLGDENQFIVSIDMQRWQDLIEAFRIQKPMMVIKR